MTRNIVPAVLSERVDRDSLCAKFDVQRKQNLVGYRSPLHVNTSMRRMQFHVRAPSLGAVAIFAGAFLIAYRFGMSFTQEIAAPFWFPDSVLLCALLLSPPSSWWAYIALTIPVRLLLIVSPDTPYWFLVACLINDSAKGLLSAALLRKVSRTPPAWLE